MMPNLNNLMSFKPAVAPDEPTALYARLSVDDANDGDSNSIVHQKEMLERYCKDNGYAFDGPAFNIYHVNPSETDDPEEYVTEVCYPVKKRA